MFKKSAFTLVELIVVVTILAILATIGFVSYSGYLTGVRDTNRIASLTSISDGLELYRTKNDLPNPDDGINIQIEGTTIANQGYVGVNVLQTIEYSKAGKDPKDDTYFSYYLTDDKKHYQLMAFLEETENLESYSIVGKTNAAVNYSNRYPKVYGKKLGILTDSNNTPVQETTTSSLNFTGGTTTDYIARFTDSQNITASGSNLSSIAGNASCKRIKELRGGSKDGVYSINPTGTGAYNVYCDMTTDGGGWTYATMLADTSIANLFETGNSNKITSLTSNVGTKGQITEMWNDNQDKDLLLQCFTDNALFKAYEEPLLIYSFKKVDIANLTRLAKQSTTFSSSGLKSKWKGYKYTLRTTYGGSGQANSLYIVDEPSGKRVFAGYGGDRISLSTADNLLNSPAGQASGGDNHQNFNITNYCVTAIR